MPLTENPSAPAPADLLTATKGCGDRLYLLTRGAMNRAITSAPPPGPAGMTNSTGFCGSHAVPLPNSGKISQTSRAAIPAIPGISSGSPFSHAPRKHNCKACRAVWLPREIDDNTLYIYLITKVASVSMICCRCQAKTVGDSQASYRHRSKTPQDRVEQIRAMTEANRGNSALQLTRNRLSRPDAVHSCALHATPAHYTVWFRCTSTPGATRNSVTRVS